jgi:peptidoglycan/xylan/chitin deacetylase (PgdA/CDA1 family)
MTKVVLGLVIYTIFEILGFIKRSLGIPTPCTTVTIYYHQVSRAHRDRFARQMDHLLRWAKPVRADELSSHAPESRRVVVTADDGWLSFVENAIPELEKRDIPLTLFVVSHRLGDNLGDPSDRLITEAELLNLRRDLVTVGSHTATHARLTTASAPEVRRELLESRERLSYLLKADVRLFCFPFGAHNDESVKLCRYAGYARAFGAQSISPAQVSNPFLVDRVRVDPTDWPIEFHLKVMGAYRGLFFAAMLRRQAQAAIFIAISRMASAARFRLITDQRRRATTNHPPDADY